MRAKIFQLDNPIIQIPGRPERTTPQEHTRHGLNLTCYAKENSLDGRLNSCILVAKAQSTICSARAHRGGSLRSSGSKLLEFASRKVVNEQSNHSLMFVGVKK